MRVGIYAGARAASPEIEQDVRRFVAELVESGLDVVYGGGRTGLMGIVADTALAAGAAVTGVVADGGEGGEAAHRGLTDLEVTADRHRRKERILELSDVVVALPGASGTLEEIVEAWSLFRLGRHGTPCALFDTGGFFDPLVELVAGMQRSGFMPADENSLVMVRSGREVVEFARRGRAGNSGNPLSSRS